jgi:hypothetical protein
MALCPSRRIRLGGGSSVAAPGSGKKKNKKNRGMDKP